MTTGENLTENPFTAAALRTILMAEKAATDAENRAAEFLSRHVDILGMKRLRKIMKREYEETLSEIIHAREEGRMNDSHSLGTGIAIYIPSEVKEHYIQNYSSGSASYVADYFESAQAIEGTNVLRLFLPNGSYYVSETQCHIFGESEIDDGFWIKDDNPFQMSFEHILRIQGSQGELWQNRNFVPFGRTSTSDIT